MLARGPLGAPVFAALSAYEQVSADYVVLAGLSGDGQATAVVAFLADEAYWSAAPGLVHATHPFGELPFGFADKGFPFGWSCVGPPFDLVYEVLLFDSLFENYPSGLGHVGHPFGLRHTSQSSGLEQLGHPSGLRHVGHPQELEHEDHPYRMIW